MTQEEKELLIKDLYARLAYSGVQIHISYEDGFEYDKTLTYDDIKNYSQLPTCSTTIVKPYLRSLSSMTDEEREELKALCDEDLNEFAGHIKNGHGLSHDGLYMFDKLRQLDWLNKKMFDFRGLIQKGLAIKALDDMYN